MHRATLQEIDSKLRMLSMQSVILAIAPIENHFGNELVKFFWNNPVYRLFCCQYAIRSRKAEKLGAGGNGRPNICWSGHAPNPNTCHCETLESYLGLKKGVEKFCKFCNYNGSHFQCQCDWKQFANLRLEPWQALNQAREYAPEMIDALNSAIDMHVARTETNSSQARAGKETKKAIWAASRP